MPTQWATVKECADHYQVTPHTIRNWISSGLIRAERMGPRLIRVDINSLEQLGRPLRPAGE